MTLRSICRESLIAERRAARLARGEKLRRATLVEPLTRLITTSEGLGQVAQAIEINVNLGREDNPTLYDPLYQTTTNADFPRLVPTNLVAQADVVFLQRFEGGEVHFGHLAKGTTSNVPIVNYSAGFEYTQEMIDYNETWAIDDFNRSFGEAYNALLNHIHLSPILTYAYTAANQTPADATAGASLTERTYLTIDAALQTAATAKRPGSVLLAASANRRQIERALGGWNDQYGNVMPPLGDIQATIFYDGYALTVGPKTYTYAGVTTGRCYLIQPRRRLRELVKRDLFIETGNPDVSRRIADQIAGHTYRGVYADVAGSVEEITLPV